MLIADGVAIILNAASWNTGGKSPQESPTGHWVLWCGYSLCHWLEPATGPTQPERTKRMCCASLCPGGWDPDVSGDTVDPTWGSLALAPQFLPWAFWSRYLAQTWGWRSAGSSFTYRSVWGSFLWRMGSATATFLYPQSCRDQMEILIDDPFMRHHSLVVETLAVLPSHIPRCGIRPPGWLQVTCSSWGKRAVWDD